MRHFRASERKRYPLAGSLVRFLVERYITYVSKINIGKFPQLATYAFDYIGIQVLLYGRYEERELRLLIEFLSNKMPRNYFQGVVLDIGANIGNHSLFFSEYFHNVLSFEPNPWNFDLLRINTKRAANISTYNMGLSTHEYSAPLYFSRSNFGGATAQEYSEDDDVESIDAKFINLDSSRSIIGDRSISLIKIDTEGHEFEVLSGAHKLVEEHSPIIVFEQHLIDFETGKSRVIEYLRTLGYYEFGYISSTFFPILGEVKTSNILLRGFLKSLLGVRERIVFESVLTPAFYPLVIAIPQKLRTCLELDVE